MKFTIGNDIVEIEKLTKVYKSNPERFLLRVFSQDEIKYCLSKHNPMIHFAGKFAAKEAVKKALSSTSKANITFKNIVINNKQNGMPYVVIRNNDKIYNFSISISHTETYASAVALSYSDE